MPALVTVAPSPAAPCASSASIHEPDSRVSRPTSSRGDAMPCGSARTTAAPSRRTVGGSRGNWPALLRTPSVPKRRGADVVVSSVFDTGDPHLYGGWLDTRDAGALGGVGMDREFVLAFTKAAYVDVGRHVLCIDS